MGSLLQQLENNEAVLLMYLADELPAEDRLEVEQLLARDAGLRAELERLRDMTDALTLALTDADGVGIAPPPIAAAAAIPGDAIAAKQSAAVRRVSRLMSQRRAHREALEAREDAAGAAAGGIIEAAARGRRRRYRWALRIPTWSYPFAAAAAVLIAWVAYWGFTSSGTGQRDQSRPPLPEHVDDQATLALMRSLEPEDADRQAIVSAFSAEDPAAGGDLGTLMRVVGQEVSTLQADKQRAPTNE
jgi:hypothetical protein